MTKRMTMATIASVAAIALAVVAFSSAGNAIACDKAAKDGKKAQATSSCSKAKTASSSSCTRSAEAKTACSKSTAAKTASATDCSKSASAETASSGCCAGAAAKTASASGCDKSAKTASASSCSKSAKTASAGCCEGKAAVAGYAKTAGKHCDSKECPASACDDEYAEALNKIVDEIPQGERSRVIVAGTIECAHCTYDAVGSCQPLLKTADGKVYPMLHSNLVKEMKHSGARQVEVTSNVRNAHGVKYLDVKTFKAL